MVQFLSINFFGGDFFKFCWVFQKFPFFLSLCTWETWEDSVMSVFGRNRIGGLDCICLGSR